ncbi:MAG: hypothetical protein N2203_08895, partial [Bacteroidia bacterium]|nr:hypothetical protein [Bacteroidia bacterium]
NEIPAAQKLVKPYNDFLEKNKNTLPTWLLQNHPKWEQPKFISINNQIEGKPHYSYFNHSVPVVINTIVKDNIQPVNFFSAGYIYNINADKWNLTDFACDYIYIKDKEIQFEIPGSLNIIQDYQKWKLNPQPQHYPLLTISSINELSAISSDKIFVHIDKTEELEKINHNEKKNLILIISID